jgi:hypothetical protein
MSTEYEDRWITCTSDEIAIRGYYIPWGTKHIPYERIRSVERVNLGVLTGRARIWGTASPRFWANLDPGRPRKKVGLILNVGRSVQPIITPDDPGPVEESIRAHAGDVIVAGGRAPIV